MPHRRSRYPLTHAVPILGGSAALLFAIGCAPQATTDYQGDPMFSLTGRVEAPLTSATDGPLIPSIAFVGPTASEVHFVDAEVHGEFPAQFELDLYTPPPAGAVAGFAESNLADEPHYSIGHIAAVTADHLPMMYIGTELVGVANSCEDAGCSQTFQVSGGGHTGTATVFCAGETPEMPAALWQCLVTERSGDPMFATSLLDPMFAGAVSNYVVGYLESSAPAGSVVAQRFGAPDGLGAGYHLLRVAPPTTEPEEAVKQACRDDALMIATERYNAAHGTDIRPPAPGCTSCGEFPEELRGEWTRAQAEMDCLFGPEYTPVADPSSEPVSLQVVPGLNFALAANGQI